MIDIDLKIMTIMIICYGIIFFYINIYILLFASYNLFSNNKYIKLFSRIFLISLFLFICDFSFLNYLNGEKSQIFIKLFLNVIMVIIYILLLIMLLKVFETDKKLNQNIHFQFFKYFLIVIIFVYIYTSINDVLIIMKKPKIMQYFMKNFNREIINYNPQTRESIDDLYKL